MKAVKEVNIKDQLVDIKPTYESYNWTLVSLAGLLGVLFIAILFYLIRKMRKSKKKVKVEINWEKLVDDIITVDSSPQEAESEMMMLLKSFLEANARLPFSSKSDNETINLINESNKFKKEQKEIIINFLTDSEKHRFSSTVSTDKDHVEKRKSELKNIVRNLNLAKGESDELR